jgi:hypothetical protein
MAEDDRLGKKPAEEFWRKLQPFRIGAYAATGGVTILYSLLRDIVPWLNNIGVVRLVLASAVVIIASGFVSHLIIWLLRPKS